MSTKIHQPEIF